MATTGERGDLFRVSVAFTNSAGAATDPTTVTFTVLEPDGMTTSFIYPATVVKDSTGNYHCDWTAAKDGAHDIYFAGTGTVQRVYRDRFFVNARSY
jgi:uncharacterized protein YfaS (alpha-2-macroglobulin family)